MAAHWRAFCAGVILMLACTAHSENALARRLESSVKLYEAGEYVATIDSLTTIFPVLGIQHELRAYKYLAYSYAMLQMTERASMLFHAALEKYPGMMIDTLEVPPPIVSIFKEVQAQRLASMPRQVRAKANSQVAVGAVLLVASAGGLFLSGFLAGSSDETPAMMGSVAAGVVSAVLLPVSVYMIRRPDGRQGKRIALRLQPLQTVAGVW